MSSCTFTSVNVGMGRNLLLVSFRMNLLIVATNTATVFLILIREITLLLWSMTCWIHMMRERVMAPACDSASNNDTFTLAMENKVKYPKMLLWRADLRVRCLDQILNLVAKGFLSRFKKAVMKKRVVAGIGTSIMADEVALARLEAELRESGFTEAAELEDLSEETQAQAVAIDAVQEEAASKASCSAKEELESRFMLTKVRL
ncbi:hypothetical protein BT69DRAFT_128457 [Atractiella rhizophila]|nr:hypothetical protein BT69DRAFT_128457 [Atractiella rhizophila]